MTVSVVDPSFVVPGGNFSTSSETTPSGLWWGPWPWTPEVKATVEGGSAGPAAPPPADDDEAVDFSSGSVTLPGKVEELLDTCANENTHQLFGDSWQQFMLVFYNQDTAQ